MLRDSIEGKKFKVSKKEKIFSWVQNYFLNLFRILMKNLCEAASETQRRTGRWEEGLLDENSLFIVIIAIIIVVILLIIAIIVLITIIITIRDAKGGRYVYLCYSFQGGANFWTMHR